MTSIRPGDSGSATLRGAYHNSGAGPREVFRTAAIGKTALFDVGDTLRLWRPTGEDRTIRGKLDRRKVTLISPEIIDRACAITLDLLGVAQIERNNAANPSQRALKSLVVLAGEVIRAGAVENLPGLACALPGAGRDITLSIQQDVDTLPALQVAITLVAVSVFAPPLILWTRPPSFTWWRLDYIITLRTFGASNRAGDGRPS